MTRVTGAVVTGSATADPFGPNVGALPRLEPKMLLHVLDSFMAHPDARLVLSVFLTNCRRSGHFRLVTFQELVEGLGKYESSRFETCSEIVSRGVSYLVEQRYLMEVDKSLLRCFSATEKIAEVHGHVVRMMESSA